MLLGSIHLSSFVCETCVIYIYIYIYSGVTNFFNILCSILMMFHRKYRFNQTDTEQYRHRYRTEVRYRFRFSEQTGRDPEPENPTGVRERAWEESSYEKRQLYSQIERKTRLSLSLSLMIVDRPPPPLPTLTGSSLTAAPTASQPRRSLHQFFTSSSPQDPRKGHLKTQGFTIFPQSCLLYRRDSWLGSYPQSWIRPPVCCRSRKASKFDPLGPTWHRKNLHC